MGPLTPTPLMDTIYDLIEEAKLRFLWWALCIFSISYFFTHTSKSMWMNIPISIVFVAALRILSNKVEFHWKVQPPTRRTYLSHLEKKQLSPNDGRLSSSPPRPKWKKKIDSPVVEAALNDFIDLILKDFVVDLWYSEITSDREFPEQIRDLVMDALAEVTGRVKEINLVDLITRDIVDLIGDHIDLFRRNQAAIGVDVMLTLSSEERDERLKFHLLNSKELHPALISPESSSAASEWGISYSAKTTRSSMSGHSIYSSGNYNLLGIATCFGFGKPWVMGAYFEKLSSKSFAVYSIAVTNGQEKTWFVKRRYRNFERLHRHLKEIPNYTLHLPPKRIFYSSTEDAFVHQRCIQLNKYLQDLLSIANVAEQHEVWDFLSVSSKSYSFGKSSSMMRTLAVNVDDAVDDIARQFKGVPNGLIRKAGCSTSPTTEGSVTSNTWNSADELDKNISRHIASESVLSSDNEQEAHVGYENIDGEVAEDNGWHSDNELSSKDYSQQVVNHGKESSNLDQDRKHDVMMEAKVGKDVSAANLTLIPDNLEDPDGVPPEWTPPNVSVPILNLVDNIFQLKKRGWLRRQVFWISKQILQLVMEDAIDDCLLREIHWLRREDTVAQGIRWIQDILWPGGTFFVRLRAPQVLSGGSGIDQKLQTLSESGGIKMAKSGSGSFEQQLEAARRASDVKKLLFDGAPAALVSLIGQKQYRRCASDIYYFSQSSICVKQLAYAIFELLLISIFPEMRNVVMSVHENMHVHQPV
ncbi:PREDICTED: uncharacterized protein LOC109330697 isoform X5 [Lupinus angustifolius]|uniref:uncharacterized protein LOC109330697 isoform X5 n=1 Tax=Lupinus angustifolius TaxID=3871 RepID=UPI00092FC7BE|nr:PREDICTED: uncharacterized protein LOC109330697 isoform X5 [Lupinus angustifolius]